MKLLRIWLLVLLAVLLPVRGAMAAAMACPPPASAAAQQLGAQAGDHGHGSHGHGEAGHSHGGDHATADPAHAAGPADKCNMCTASCATPPVPSAAAGLAAALEPASAPFPDLPAAAPIFLSDGQDRPPRTI